LRHSYPWYIADWRMSDARMALNNEQRGIYRELLDHLYYTGFLPNDEKQLSRISTSTEKEWRRSWPKIRPFFTTERDGLVNKKASQVIDKLHSYETERQKSGRKGAEARWHGSANSSVNGSAIAQPSPRGWPPSSSSLTSSSSPSPPATLATNPDLSTEVQEPLDPASERLANILGVDPALVPNEKPKIAKRKGKTQTPEERSASLGRLEAQLREEMSRAGPVNEGLFQERLAKLRGTA
jgi:uncharacterized protein YdaU (DUF1376 family)